MAPTTPPPRDTPDDHRSSEWDEAPQDTASVPWTGTNAGQAGESSPDETPNLARVVDTADGTWDAWNQHRTEHGSLGAPTHDHRGRGGDHRTHDARAGNLGTDHREHRDGYGADDAGRPDASWHGGAASRRQEIVQQRRREAFSALTNREEWRTFAMEIEVWDWTLQTLEVDEQALKKLHELAEIKVGGLAYGYMMANGIISKVLDKVSKVEDCHMSKFVMTSCKNAVEKLALKRKVIEQTSGAASSGDHRPYKGAKNK